MRFYPLPSRRGFLAALAALLPAGRRKRPEISDWTIEPEAERRVVYSDDALDLLAEAERGLVPPTTPVLVGETIFWIGSNAPQEIRWSKASPPELWPEEVKVVSISSAVPF